MADDLGPIVIDPHAFRRLWPMLAVWLALFLTAGDGWRLIRRQFALRLGRRAQAVIEERRKVTQSVFFGRERRTMVAFAFDAGDGVRRAVEPVGAAGGAPKSGRRVPIHVRGGDAFLDDDLGYSRWKLGLFGAAFAGLWLWAAAAYRFG